MGCGTSAVKEGAISSRENTTVAMQYPGPEVKKERMIQLPREERHFEEDGRNMDNNKERKQVKKPSKPTFWLCLCILSMVGLQIPDVWFFNHIVFVILIFCDETTLFDDYWFLGGSR